MGSLAEGSPDYHIQGFPIIFHGVMGKDEREGNSPSFFNPEEAATVTSYLKLLLAPSSKKGKARLSPRSVGVISPYRKQVRPCVPVEGWIPACPRWFLFHSQTLSGGSRAQASTGPLSQRISEVSCPPSLPPSSLASCLAPSCTGVMA